MFEHIHAHKYTIENRELLKDSDLCGCCRCHWIYEPNEIDQWVHENENGIEVTATCSRCGIDSVVPEKAGYILTNELLKKMNNYWFELVKHFTPEQLVEQANIELLNKYYLRPHGFRIKIENQSESDPAYVVFEGLEDFYKTNNPKELLIKVAQLLPDSDVTIEYVETQKGDGKDQTESMVIHIHQQIPD